jgi:hypothetical protein
LASRERSSTGNDQCSRSSWVLQYRFMRAPGWGIAWEKPHENTRSALG